MKTIILALCIFAVAFAAPGKGRRPPKTDEDGNTLPPPIKDDVELTEEELADLIEACEALADDEEKRQDEPELEEVCKELAKMLEEEPKGPRPTQEAEKRGRKGPRTDEDGNTLPPRPKPSKEEFEALIEECEALADDEKRQDEPELEEVCSKLAKMLEMGPKGPRPTQEAEKRGRKGPRTDEDGNTLPPRPKPSKEEFEALIEECEALADDEKRQDEPELEEVCNKLAKMLEMGPKGPRPTQETEKRADLDTAAQNFGVAIVGLCQGLEGLIELANSAGNQKRSWESVIESLVGVCTEVQTLIEADIGSAKRGMPSKDEVEALIEECEALAEDEEKRQNEPELEEVCKELAKMLENGPKRPRPTQEAEKRGRKGPRTDEDGNTLPPRPKLSEDELEALKEECEALANDEEKREDEPALEEVCRKLAKMMMRPKPRTDEDGNPVPRPTKPAQERRRFHF